MAIDPKYGRVTLEHGDHIPDDEPVVVFRASDRLLPALLDHYFTLCENAGSPQRHLDIIRAAYERVIAWQACPDNETKVPDSETSRAWMP